MNTAVFVLVLAFSSASAGAIESGAELVSAKVASSVVRLGNFEGEEQEGHGSAFLIADGILVTNHHVIDAVTGNAFAVFRDGKKVPVLGVLADDEAHDIAILKIEGHGYPFLTLAPAGAVKAGQRVVAIGSPLGFDQTISMGIISAVRDGYPEEVMKHHPENAAKKVGLIIQHTAAIAPGSSGSPLVDMDGQVVGVNHSIIGGTEIYFAAHVDELRALLAKTDLNAKPKPLGPNLRRNLLISAGIFAAFLVAWFIATRRG